MAARQQISSCEDTGALVVTLRKTRPVLAPPKALRQRRSAAPAPASRSRAPRFHAHSAAPLDMIRYATHAMRSYSSTKKVGIE
eukprot:6212219-Pleurochrysis_carterae.AAC.1